MNALSRFATKAPPVTIGLVDPDELTAAEKDWLRRLCTWRHYRWKNGWKAHGEAKVLSLTLARRLFLRHLIRYANDGQTYIEPTGLGRATLAILDERIRAARARRVG